jgi:cyanophycinase
MQRNTFLCAFLSVGKALSFLSLIFFIPPAFDQGSILLVGGGSENYNDWSDEPYRWLVQRAANKKILILHYSDASTFLPNYFQSLGATTATNLVISSRTLANDSSTYRNLMQADGIFLRGGDQWRYVELWQGTLAEKALREIYQRGGVIGGTSAGAMVLSAVVFDARQTSVDPRAALRSPLNASITFTENFLGVVPEILADTHFYERGRIGRLLAMLAVYRAQKAKWIAGVGIDDRTALGVAADGSAEVFGSGVVTILRPTPQTNFTVQAGRPLALSNVLCFQLTKGFRLNLQTGQLQSVPSTATPFTPKSLIPSPAPLFVDGSNSSADWLATSGSLAKLLNLLAPPADTLGVFSSPTSPTVAQNLSTQLSQRNAPHRLLWMNEVKKNDAAIARDIRNCKGFIFVANNLDSAAVFFDQTTLAGNALRDELAAGAATAFLGNDAKLLGANGVGQTEISTTAAYRGRLTLFSGLNFFGGLNLMPRAYENSDYHENRASGLFWGMAKTQSAYGVFLDAGTHLQISHTTLQVFGATPALIVDAAVAKWIDFSTYRASSSIGPRQSAALTPAIIHVVPDSAKFTFSTSTSVAERSFEHSPPTTFQLDQNFPNPFHRSTQQSSATTITYQLPRAERVTLKIYNLLGQAVRTLVEADVAAGVHAASWDAKNDRGEFVSSGVYIYQLRTGNQIVRTKKMLLAK